MVEYAQNLEEVLQQAPDVYRPTVRKLLSALRDYAQKEGSSSQTLRKLQAHKANSTFPPQLIGCHEPIFALSKEFAATQPADLKAIHAAWDNFRGTALDKAIALKAAEVEWLRNELLPEQWYGPAINRLAEFYNSHVLASSKVPTFDAEGVNVVAWDVNPDAERIASDLRKDLAFFGNRVIAIERTKTRESYDRLAQKLSLKTDTDVEMGE
ncbi:hypothetical protein BD410DRAFT_880522, partial [Rickenella mellea]